MRVFTPFQYIIGADTGSTGFCPAINAFERAGIPSEFEAPA
jgi:hypothetical protein